MFLLRLRRQENGVAVLAQLIFNLCHPRCGQWCTVLLMTAQPVMALFIIKGQPIEDGILSENAR